MTKLSTYTNNLFATHATLDVALENVTSLANASETPSAIITAVHVILNTAIAMHKAELAAYNKPLIELIDARVAAALENMQSYIEDKISDAIADFGIEDKISDAIDEYDFSGVVERAMENNPIDVKAFLSGTNISITFD